MAQNHHEIHFDYRGALEGEFVGQKRDRHTVKGLKEALNRDAERDGTAEAETQTRKRLASELVTGMEGLEDSEEDEDDEGGAKKPTPVAASAPPPEKKVKTEAKGREGDQSVECGVVVKGLGEGLSEDDIKLFFSSCGNVVEATLWRKHSGQSKGTAFVVFGTQEERDKALKKSGATVLGSTISVEPKRAPKPQQSVASEGTEASGAPSEPKKCVFVRNVYPNVPEGVFKQFFSAAGKIEEYRIMAKKKCALVEYETPAGAAEALKLTGRTLMGQKLEIQYDKTNQGLKRILTEEARHRQLQEQQGLLPKHRAGGKTERTPEQATGEGQQVAGAMEVDGEPKQPQTEVPIAVASAAEGAPSGSAPASEGAPPSVPQQPSAPVQISKALTAMRPRSVSKKK